MIQPSKASGLNKLALKLGRHSFEGASQANITNLSGSGVRSVTITVSDTLYGLRYEADISPNVASRFCHTNYNKLASVSGRKASVYSIGLDFKFQPKMVIEQRKIHDLNSRRRRRV